MRGVGWLNVKEGYDYTSGRDELRKKNSGLDFVDWHTFLLFWLGVEMLIWIKWLEKRAIRIEIRWERRQIQKLERDKLVEKCQRERILWGGWDPLIFELLKAPPFICGEPIPPTSFFLFFLTRHAHAPFWHFRPTFFFFFFIQLFATKAFCSFQKRSSKMQFLCSTKSEYISFVLLYLFARILLKFYAFLLYGLYAYIFFSCFWEDIWMGRKFSIIVLINFINRLKKKNILQLQLYLENGF